MLCRAERPLPKKAMLQAPPPFAISTVPLSSCPHSTRAPEPCYTRTLEPATDILAVSGWGADGAFGAGLLTGWTDPGTRPDFKLVTGVSTGALTGPFAFPGPAWDPQPTALYTSIKSADVFEKRGLTAAIWNDAVLCSNEHHKVATEKSPAPPIMSPIARATAGDAEEGWEDIGRCKAAHLDRAPFDVH
jgi:hypothetical protein